MSDKSVSDKTGLVLRIDAKRCHVEVGDEVFLLSPQGKLFENKGLVKNPVAVGDRVCVELDGEGSGSITEVLPRQSKFSRKSAGESALEQILVANLDLALVVSSVRDPKFRPRLVDRILAGCERQGIEARLLINKVDLEDSGETQAEDSAAYWCALYEELGYDCMTLSTVTNQGIDALYAVLEDRISVFCGLSGVGKSSLLNAVEPGLALAIGTISQSHREGRHTTTHSSLLRLKNGGHVVDTPGIRNFGLFGVAPTEVAELFKEFHKHLGHCKFNDCIHHKEPACAIRNALDNGEIQQSRYESYLELLEDAKSGQLKS